MNPPEHISFIFDLITGCRNALRIFWRIAAVLVFCLAARSPALAQTQALTVKKYYQDDGHGNCITWGASDDVCVNLSVTVNGDAMPGDYTYDLLCNPDIIGGGGNVVRNCCGYGHTTGVHVNADHTYSLDPDSGLACLTNAGGRGASHLYLDVQAPTGASHSEGDVSININTVYCAGSPQTLVVEIPVTIGPGSPYTKPCDEKLGGDGGGCGSSKEDAMAHYSAHAMLASLNIEDTPFRYSPPIGPAINFTVTYSQRETQQPRTFNYSNLGPKWTFNWLAYVTDDPNNASADATVYVSGGGAERYTGFDLGSQSYQPDPQSHAVLARVAPSSYEKRFPDGSKQAFTLSDGSGSPRRIFMTQWIDPTGNAVTIGYDASFRVTTITDALGQVTTLAYELASDPLKITKVTEPFPTGRYASFTYNANGQLVSITDEIGIQSQFHYGVGTNFIDSLTTPYGTSNFTTGQSGSNRWIEMTDPLGGKERIEYRDNAPGISDSDSPATIPAGFTNSGLSIANTFYWDKKAIEMYPPVNGTYDYTKAKLVHWCYNADGTPSGIIASEKAALENRVWYSYSGQSDTNHAAGSARPNQVGRILDDGSTRLWQYQHNNLGKITQSIDPVGRVMTYLYDTNGIDMLEVRQTTGAANELVRKLTYNSQHKPLTDTDAAGQPTTLTYNSSGQILTSKNAKNETTTYGYGDGTPGHPVGYLTSVASPPFSNVSAVTSFTYDTANRPRAVTDSDGYTITTDYDNLDRPTQVTYPDGTNQQFQYSQDFGQGLTTILDLTKTKDRRGLWTTRHYNANRQMDSITDPLNRTTQFGWCTCGALTNITDPRNQTTTFNRDLQSRVIGKAFADNTSVSYAYENTTSRLKSTKDALNQTTNYQYFADDNLKQISYINAIHATPAVNFTYDPNYNRVAMMIDGNGTTTYGYNPIANSPALGAGQLASINGPLTNDTITFGYDHLGRVTGRSINGSANAASWIFDSLGRVSSNTNKLGTFNYNYVNVTDRLGSMTYPDGGSVVYSYFPNAQDKRLQEIKNQTSSNALISQFDYTYDNEGQILTWTKNYPGLSPAPQRFDLGYDNADQLTSAPLKNAITNALIKQYIYGYDFASNRASEVVGTITTTSTPNIVNEIVSQSGGTNRTLTYDANGSLINDGSSRTFEWDGANRLVAVNYTGTNNRTEFSYDGLSRMVKIVEKSKNGRISSTRKFVWCGMEKCEFRDATDAVSTFVYNQGQVSASTPYFYTRDHLGSIREMRSTGKKGAIVARFDYDPYGRSTSVISNTLPDFNFTGLYRHSASNVDFAVYRAYDPDLGRWLNRDPVGENGGINLYSYVTNMPITGIDPLGHDIIVLLASKKVCGQGHIATLIGNNNGPGWLYFSRNGYDRAPWLFGAGNFTRAHFDTFADFKSSPYAGQYDQAYQIKTGPDRDAAMIQYAEEHYNERYHSIIPPSNNCADLTEETLEAGGIPITGNNQYPVYDPFGYLDPFNSGYIGSPEVPKKLFRNITCSCVGHLWQVPP